MFESKEDEGFPNSDFTMDGSNKLKDLDQYLDRGFRGFCENSQWNLLPTY